MCEVCQHISHKSLPKGGMIVYLNGKADPTKTTMLRASFVKDMTARFRTLRLLVAQAIVDKDCFGLSQPTVFSNRLQNNALPPDRGFVFSRSADKVNAFMEWLGKQVNSGILGVSEGQQIGQAIENAWTNMYIQDSYKRGVIRGRYQLNKAGFNVPSLAETGGINTSMMMPFHMDRLGVLYSRTFNDLKGITSNMDTQISRVLAQGIADGDSPRLLASKMNAVISGGGETLAIKDSLGRFIPAERRAATLARTEIIRAHHAATIQEYRNWGAEGVNVQAEWSTAGFDVCEECEELQGKVFSLDEIEGMIPVHPNCRCLALPYLPPVEDIAQAGATAVEEAVPEVQAPIWPEEGISITKEAMEERTITRWDDTLAGKALNDAKIANIYLDEDVSALKTKVNVIGKTIADDIHAKLPKVEEMAENTGHFVNINITGQSNLMGNAQVFGYYSPDWGEITVGSKAMARTKYNVLKFGQGNIGLSLPQTIAHEYGHHIHLRLLNGADRNKWARFYSGKRRTGYFKKYVSIYADTNHEEAFAETFSAYIHPDYKSGMLPKELEELLESIIGRRTDL